MPVSSEKQRWLSKLEDVIDAISKRDGAKQPSQEEFNKAAAMTARDNVAIWCPDVRLYHVTDNGRRHMVALSVHGAEIITGECSCDVFAAGETCAHLLAVLANDSGTLTP